MWTLGLHNDEDSGVALMHDGVIIEALNEERLSRVKLHQGFPDLSLASVLKRHQLSLSDIDRFVYAWHGRQTDIGEYALRLARRVMTAVKNDPTCEETILQRIESEFKRDDQTRIEFENKFAEFGIPSEKVVYLDHHAAHAWGAFACSPFERAVVFTFDGRGDLKSTTVSSVGPEGMKEHHNLLSFDSLGFLYGQITHYLGFKPHRHEGKITGLAAFGNPDATLQIFRRAIAFVDGEFRSNLGFFRPFYTNRAKEFEAALRDHRPEDIAAGLQKHCEDLIISYVSHWLSRLSGGGQADVCLAGGVAANVKINQKIAEIAQVRRLFVFPHMGDGGLPLAGLCLDHFMRTGKPKVRLSDVYIGPSYSDIEIELALDAAAGDVEYVRSEDPVGGAIEDLLSSKVVGWFDGRMEFGPRALGARSILYQARDPSANDWLNKRMRRTEFMPFAPVTPEEFASECYVGWSIDDVCTPFMTKTFHCSVDFKERHKAVVHIDGTARPQTVNAIRNGTYYSVVRGYCDRSGDRALINTSFNAHEEPIVCSPADAIRGLVDNVIDVLWIRPYRAISKRQR